MGSNNGAHPRSPAGRRVPAAWMIACFALLWSGSHAVDVHSDQGAWRKPFPSPAPPSLATSPLAPASATLSIHLFTIPAYGHYMTLRDVGLALAARGHSIVLFACASVEKWFIHDGLHTAGMKFVATGHCPVYDDYDRVMANLLKEENLESIGAVLDGVATLADQMCEVAMPVYEALNATCNLPDAIVFDADTFCAVDVSIRYRIPRIARVGTGPRDVYTNPATIPQYGTALPIDMTFWQRVTNVLSILSSRLLVSPFVLPRLQARSRQRWLQATVTPDIPTAAAISGSSSSSPGRNCKRPEGAGNPVDVNPDEFRPDIPWDGMPTLFNTHWGLEYARPLMPYEHIIGHTTDFEKEAQTPIDPAVLRWLAAAPSIPVVYVGLGTLSILGGDDLRRIAGTLMNSTGFRFIWSVPPAQQSLLPSSIRDYSTQWLSGNSGEPRVVAPGDVLIADWIPQQAVLMHNMVRTLQPCVYNFRM